MSTYRPVFKSQIFKATKYTTAMQSILRLIVSLLLVICIFNLGYSQLRKNNKKKKNSVESKKAIVQYNDGSVFVGDIVFEGTLNLKMILATNDTVSLNKVNIKRIKRGDKNISLFKGAKFHYTKGFFMALQFGGMNSGDFDNETIELTLIGGYRLNKKLAVGLGIGVANNSTFSFGTWISATTTPIFAYARFYPFDKKVKPFIASSIGWGFPDRDPWAFFNHSGGLYFQPEIGVNFASRRRMRIKLSIGQQIQHIRGTDINFDQFFNQVTTKIDLWFNRTIFKIGLDWK